MSDLPDIVTHFIMHSLSEEENEAREGASTEIVDTPKEEEKRIDNVVETREEGVETDKPNSACNSRGVYSPSSQRRKSSMTASNEHVVAVDDDGNRGGRSDRLPTPEEDYGGRSLKRRAVDV